MWFFFLTLPLEFERIKATCMMYYWPREATVCSVNRNVKINNHGWKKQPDQIQGNHGFTLGSFNLAFCDWPHSIYQYFNMALRLSEQTSIFGVVSLVSRSPLGIERQIKKLQKFRILTRKPQSHVRILIYRTWPIWRAVLSARPAPAGAPAGTLKLRIAICIPAFSTTGGPSSIYE